MSTRDLFVVFIKVQCKRLYGITQMIAMNNDMHTSTYNSNVNNVTTTDISSYYQPIPNVSSSTIPPNNHHNRPQYDNNQQSIPNNNSLPSDRG
ncbi:hypothetical protein RclHR1_02580002 [Rhizophagus clarus]|nr:hypothetical protein RclHR1_02580002 [Rhizophagus clarus]